MSSYIDKITLDCESYTECTKKCPHYNDCIAEFKLNDTRINNPSTMQAEINGFELYDSKNNTPDNFKINICEVPGVLINQALISQFNSDENIEIKNIISAALNKFNTMDSYNVNSTIIKYEPFKYHFVFNCVDCNGLNDFIDYAMDDQKFFYCRYCGKKHRFDLSKAIDKSANNTPEEVGDK